MLYCDVAADAAAGFDDLAVFVDQLNAVGRPARLGAHAVPTDAARSHRFDAAMHLGEAAMRPDEALVLIGAHALRDETLTRLRRNAGACAPDCIAMGRFDTAQAEIGTRAKLSYVLGREPRIVRLDAPSASCPVFGAARAPGPIEAARPPTVLVLAPRHADAAETRALRSLARGGRVRVLVLTDGKAKRVLRDLWGDEIGTYNYNEFLPSSLAGQVDVVATFAGPSPNYRRQSLIANLVRSGVAMIDCTEAEAFADESDAFIRGPVDVAALGTFLRDDVLPRLDEVAEAVLASRHAAALDPDAVLRDLPSAPVDAAASSPRAPRSGVVVVPTNGVGLGHAQRTSLIAAAMDPSGPRPTFAAFPSCMRMLQGYGFDVMPLVSRSPLHAAEHENDLLNYVRLRALTRDARALVFDGGYVFDSIYRTILENDLRGVWIRRGLWQAGQDNGIALDREKVFERVIVPTEAFAELNQAYSRGDHLHPVGPVVQRLAPAPDARAALRDRLAARYGPFEHLVVTMLGGGVAADRKAQLAAIGGMMERRRGVLNLIVVWPTATVEAGCFAWSNTRVVKTHHASALVAACDLMISAVGYNSFHEVLYNRVPAIFLPQMSAMMDDQRARAAAAVERDLAAMVEPHELLTLDRTVARFLDGGESEAVRARLAATDLPEPGNARAARLIEEMAR